MLLLEIGMRVCGYGMPMPKRAMHFLLLCACTILNKLLLHHHHHDHQHQQPAFNRRGQPKRQPDVKRGHCRL